MDRGCDDHQSYKFLQKVYNLLLHTTFHPSGFLAKSGYRRRSTLLHFVRLLLLLTHMALGGTLGGVPQIEAKKKTMTSCQMQQNSESLNMSTLVNFQLRDQSSLCHQLQSQLEPLLTQPLMPQQQL